MGIASDVQRDFLIAAFTFLVQFFFLDSFVIAVTFSILGGIIVWWRPDVVDKACEEYLCSTECDSQPQRTDELHASEDSGDSACANSPDEVGTNVSSPGLLCTNPNADAKSPFQAIVCNDKPSCSVILSGAQLDFSTNTKAADSEPSWEREDTPASPACEGRAAFEGTPLRVFVRPGFAEHHGFTEHRAASKRRDSVVSI